MSINCIDWLDYNLAVPLLCLLPEKLLFLQALFSRPYILYIYPSKAEPRSVFFQNLKLVIAFTVQNKIGWEVYRELILSLHWGSSGFI